MSRSSRQFSAGGVIVEAIIINIQKFSIHDGPGIRTTVFFKGCPLRCLWCSNPESQKMAVEPERDAALSGKVYSPEDVVKICLADKVFYDESGGGVTLSGGEALAQPDFAIELLRRLKSEGVHTALETSGYATSDIFENVIKHTDYLLFDLKHYDNNKHMESTGFGNELILQNLQLAIDSGLEMLVRIPVIPDYNDSLEDARKFAQLIKQFGLNETELLPFHQFGQKKYESLGMPYAYSKHKTLYPEDLQDYRNEIEKSGVRSNI